MYHEVGTGGSGSMHCPGDGSITFCGCGETIKTCGSLSFAEDPEAFWPVDAFAAVAQRTQAGLLRWGWARRDLLLLLP
jgi:hypothetical protein